MSMSYFLDSGRYSSSYSVVGFAKLNPEGPKSAFRGLKGEGLNVAPSNGIQRVLCRPRRAEVTVRDQLLKPEVVLSDVKVGNCPTFIGSFGGQHSSSGCRSKEFGFDRSSISDGGLQVRPPLPDFGTEAEVVALHT